MKIIILSSLLTLTISSLMAQSRTEDFKITSPTQKVPNSLYNTIHYIDARYDTTNMGIVQLGAFNRKAQVKPETPFGLQLTILLDSLKDASASSGELLFMLRQLSFAEITGAMSEKGYCYLKAILFQKQGDNYRKINTIDTVILIKAMDVTRAMFRNGSKTITDFIASNLTRKSQQPDHYTLHDVIHLDSIEKRSIPVYNISTYKDGAYTTFASFMNQVPDKEATVTIKEGNISRVHIPGEDGKPVKIKSKDLYAVVHNGEPYIATDFGFYPLQKRDDDFYFVGKAKVNANTGDVVVASMFFGIIGGLLASNADATFEMKIDHTNGGFIRLNQVTTSTP